ncbi:hypothetical protein [Desmospora profundinema]|uniref:Membrane protein n=1 Tax=Desmospora profundinema TaxID=1571184 RepID=A0ABU1IQH6_9BACL|nr:hypothetical protein [Desmospora profundinema]MDR6227038.1 putative membrane protein [Desmospora profundinema]
MFIKILQGMGAGLILSLVLSVILGFFLMGLDWVFIFLVTLITYLPAGYVAARGYEHPYVSAGIAGLLLMVFNQLFTIISYECQIHPRLSSV